MATKLQRDLEARLGATLRRGWILDGAGPARYGWASLHPCRERWEGRTLAEISARLESRDVRRALTKRQIRAARPLIADVFCRGIHGVTGREYEEGTLAAGTLVCAVSVGPPEAAADGSDAPWIQTAFAASTDGGVTWFWQTTYEAVRT